MKIGKIGILVAASACIATSAFAAKKPKALKATQPVTIDYQGREVGSEIPAWAKAVADNNKRKVSKELDLGDYHIWVFNSRGKNLQFLETWTDKVELQSNVAQTISSEIGRATQADMQATQTMDETQINQAIKDVTTVLSTVRVNGLEKFASYWILSGIPATKKAKAMSDYDCTYSYYSVWGIEKKAFDKQIKAAMKNLPDNTASDPLLMEILTKSIEKTVLGEIREDEGIESYDVEEE